MICLDQTWINHLIVKINIDAFARYLSLKPYYAKYCREIEWVCASDLKTEVEKSSEKGKQM